MQTEMWIGVCVICFLLGWQVSQSYWKKQVIAMLKRFRDKPDLFRNQDYLNDLGKAIGPSWDE